MSTSDPDKDQAYYLKLIDKAMAPPQGDIVVTVESHDRDLIRALWTLQGEDVEIKERLQKAGDVAGLIWIVIRDAATAAGALKATTSAASEAVTIVQRILKMPSGDRNCGDTGYAPLSVLPVRLTGGFAPVRAVRPLLRRAALPAPPPQPRRRAVLRPVREEGPDRLHAVPAPGLAEPAARLGRRPPGPQPPQPPRRRPRARPLVGGLLVTGPPTKHLPLRCCGRADEGADVAPGPAAPLLAPAGHDRGAARCSARSTGPGASLIA